MQVGLASHNDAVVCASLRVVGAVLQALISHHHWPLLSSTTSISITDVDRTCLRQPGLQELQECPPDNNTLQHRQHQHQQHYQLQQHSHDGSTSDWLDGDDSLWLPRARSNVVLSAVTSNSSSCQPATPAAAGYAASAWPAAVATAMPIHPAAVAADMVAVLTAHCRAAVSTDVQVAALSELQQVMLLLADALLPSAAELGQGLVPEDESRSSVAYSTSSSSSSKTCGNSTGMGDELPDLAWVQEVAVASMEALAQEDPTLRRYVNHAAARDSQQSVRYHGRL